MKNFIDQLDEINNRAKAEKQKTENHFNIFDALHKKHDEKKLHSRFISYLLSPTSKHGMKDLFLKAFIEIISEEHPELKNFQLQKCKVAPNEEEKVEYKDIDILIENDTQAIIVENKIYAKDSNDFNRESDHQIQLINYYNIIKEEGKKDIFVIYLTLDRHDPEHEDEIKKVLEYIKIDYRTEITNWLNKCISIVDNNLLKEILDQYKTIVISLTNDTNRAQELKELINNNINYALENRDKISGMEDFKHVRWYTVNDFWQELALKLKEHLNVEILKTISIDEITKITHQNQKRAFGFVFRTTNNEECYIVNDEQNGLTYGKLKLEETKKEWHHISKEIKFSEFNNEETFKLISSKERANIINEAIEEINSKINNTLQ